MGISEDQRRWLIIAAAKLAARGALPVGPLVLPSKAFFPDRFDRTPASIGALFRRLLGHVGLEDLPHQVNIVDPDDGQVVASCSSGGCAAPTRFSGERVSWVDDAYQIALAPGELATDAALTAIMSSAVGRMFLNEVDLTSSFAPRELGAAADVAAAMLGLAVIVANGSGVVTQGCGGKKTHAASSLGPEEAAFVLALVISRLDLSGQPPPMLGGHLDAAAQDAFPEAREWVRANLDLVRRLDDAPDGLVQGRFALAAPRRSLFDRALRILGRSDTDGDPVLELEKSIGQHRVRAQPEADSAKRARRRELAQMVEETLKDASPSK